MGIIDFAILTKIERVFVYKRLRQLSVSQMEGTFDAAHLRAVHRFLFQDVFPWAGEFRVVNISKGNTSFGPAMFIEQALADAVGKLKVEAFLAKLTTAQFAQRAAFYLGEINAVHPFREGNAARSASASVSSPCMRGIRCHGLGSPSRRWSRPPS